jgi:hemerythrin-like domain-containing protein
MDIYSYLKNDHFAVKELMEKLSNAANVIERRTIYITLREELRLHAVTEEVTFYQMLTENGSKALQEKMKYAELEHDDIEHFLRLLDITDVKTDKWLILFGQLKYCVERHIEREEGEIFEAAQKVISEAQAINLVTQIDKLRKQKAFRNVA